MYCSDTILDMQDKMTQDITMQSIERKLAAQPSKRVQTVKASPVKASPAKSDTRGNTMDAEKYN